MLFNPSTWRLRLWPFPSFWGLAYSQSPVSNPRTWISSHLYLINLFQLLVLHLSMYDCNVQKPSEKQSRGGRFPPVSWHKACSRIRHAKSIETGPVTPLVHDRALGESSLYLQPPLSTRPLCIQRICNHWPEHNFERIHYWKIYKWYLSVRVWTYILACDLAYAVK